MADIGDVLNRFPSSPLNEGKAALAEVEAAEATEDQDDSAE
jgi:hypothetical protein